MLTQSMRTRGNSIAALAAVGVMFLLALPASAGGTSVPGHQHHRYDQNDNGYPDEGVIVTGKYVSAYTYDDNGDYYWDLGDGRIQGTVDSVADLDLDTLTECVYQVQYRGEFDDDPFLDSGWIKNDINCSGYDDNGTYNYLIVHETDPRYADASDWAIWGTWEYHVLTESGQGNLVHRPDRPMAS